MSTATLEPTAPPSVEVPVEAPAPQAPPGVPWLVRDVKLTASIETNGDLHAAVRFILRRHDRRHVPRDAAVRFTDTLTQQVCEKLQANEDVQRLRKMARQLAAAQRLHALAEARLNALHHRRELVVLEVPADMADQLQQIAGETAQAQRQLGSAAQQIRVLEPEVAKLRASLDGLVEKLAQNGWQDTHAGLESEREAALAALAEVAGGALTRLAALEKAKTEWRGSVIPDARRRAAAFLDRPPTDG